MQQKEHFKGRNYWIDLYRLLCMFLITTIHIIGYSHLTNAISPGHFNVYAISILQTLQHFSISGFTLISAYFLVTCESTEKKIVKFWVQLVFFSVIILFLSLLLPIPPISFKLCLQSFFPVFSNHFWYPVNYIFLLFLAPVLNKGICRLTKKELFSVIVFFVFVVSIFFHINPFFDPSVFLGHSSHGLIWFILLYLIAAYIRIHGVSKPLLFGPICFSVSAICMFALVLLQNGCLGFFSEQSIFMVALSRIHILDNNSILSLMLAVSSFIMFMNFKSTSNNIATHMILCSAPSMFPIYLIQEHNAIRQFLWDFIDITKWANSYWLLAVILLVFILIWIVSIGLCFIYRLAHSLLLCKFELFILKFTKKMVSSHSHQDD